MRKKNQHVTPQTAPSSSCMAETAKFVRGTPMEKIHTLHGAKNIES